MTALSWVRRRVRLPAGPGDAVLAFGLLVFALAELVAARELPREVAVPGAIAMTLPLLWRQAAPVAVLAIVTGAFATQTALGVPDNAQVAAFGAILAACYSVGAYAPRMAAVGGLALGLLLTGLTVPLNPEASGGDFAFVAVVIGGAWATGRIVRTHSRESRTQQQRAAHLAATSEERARQAAEAERRRLGRELHDIIAHSVSLMVVQAGGAEQVARSDPDRTIASLVTIQETGRQALVEMRRLLGLLRDPEHDDEPRPLPRLDQLGILVEQVRAAGVTVELSIEGPRRPLSEGVESSAFRIVQEALTNVIKHAGGAHVAVVVRFTEHDLFLEISDDGAGSAPTGTQGKGLIGMRERAELFEGELEAVPLATGGFRVRARFPLATPV